MRYSGSKKTYKKLLKRQKKLLAEDSCKNNKHLIKISEWIYHYEEVKWPLEHMRRSL